MILLSDNVHVAKRIGFHKYVNKIHNDKRLEINLKQLPFIDAVYFGLYPLSIKFLLLDFKNISPANTNVEPPKTDPSTFNPL